MRTVVCDNCQRRDIPQNLSVIVDGQTLCVECFETKFQDKDELNERVVQRKMDPTVCSLCNADNGALELDLVGKYPYCIDCRSKLKRKLMPVWVQVFFFSIIALVVFSAAWNWKYYDAYRSLKTGIEYAGTGEIKKAADLLESASEQVPESKDLATLTAFYKGVNYLFEDDSKNALKQFSLCQSLPPEYNVYQLMRQAGIGVAFDEGDYDTFLKAAKEDLQADSSIAANWAAVASAYACLYARGGQEIDKHNTYACLLKAKLIDNKSPEALFYYNLIEYRVESRNIISRKEFTRKFPNGWKQN